ncbi:amino acid permease [Streptomyces umbrinus]
MPQRCPVSHSRPAKATQNDDAVLASLGFRPELARRMGEFGSFAVAFSVICPLAGLMTLYLFGMNTGGPSAMIWGWIVIGPMTLLLGMSLAEVTSRYPTSGGLYFMAEQLGGRGWAWVAGWLNFLGLLGAIAGVVYGCATFVAAFASLQWGLEPTPGTIILIFAGLLVLHGILNSFGVRLAAVLNSVSVWWQIGGVLLIVGALALAPVDHQSAGFVFGHFSNATGIDVEWFVFGLGSLVAAYTFCGYDASSHLSEETTDAQTSAPKGMVRSIYVSWIVGFVLLAGLGYSIQDYAATQATSTGVPPAQIFIDVVGMTGAKLLLLVVIGAQFLCGNAATTSASRMMYAFSRITALPFSETWRHVNQRTRTPILAVWGAVGVGFLLALPSLYSPTAYAAVTAINVIGITPSYAIPVYLRLRAGKNFTPGPWNLGRWSRPVGTVAVVYVAILAVVFCLPQASPITVQSFNYAGVALAVALLLAWVTWIGKGRRSYKVSPLGSEAENIALAGDVV